jgi:hypothetical protein
VPLPDFVIEALAEHLSDPAAVAVVTRPAT